MKIFLTPGQLESYLALKPIRQLVTDFDLDIEYLPMLASLGNIVGKAKPGENDPLARYKARRARARTMAADRERERMIEILGIAPETAKRTVDPLMLSLGLLWLNEHKADALSYLEHSFDAIYTRGAEVESVDAIRQILVANDVATTGFAQFAQSQAESLKSSSDRLLEEGVLFAPAFVLDDEIFHGREHIPLLRWLLGGRRGVPPV